MKLFYSVLFSALCIATSYTQEKKDTTKTKRVKLDEIIVKGNIKTDPIHSIIVHKYAKKVVQPKNVADLFNDINGFSVIKRGNYAIDPSFRASQYEQLNIQYDGGTKAMHACPNRMDPITTHMIPEEISKIEVIKGPYTVRYGSTFGGIINLVSQKPSLDDHGFHGSISGGFETNGNSYVSRMKLAQIGTNYNITGNYGYRNFGNYKDGVGVEIPSSFESNDYSLKLGVDLSEKQYFQIQWRQSYGKDVLHAALPMDTDYDNSSILSLDYKADKFNGLVKSVTAKAYYSFVKHLMHNKNRPSFRMMEAVAAIDATTIGGKVEMKLQPRENFSLYTGIDALYIGRDGGRNRLVKVMNGNPLPMPMTFDDKIWQDSYLVDYGLFSEAKWSTNESAIFTAGVRYDLVITDIKDPEEDFAAMYTLGNKTEHNFSGTVSVKKMLTDNFIVEVAYGRGVRTPNMMERYINHFTIGQDPYEYIGNPNLDSEVNNQFEIGFKGYIELNNQLNRFSYTTSFYHSIFENYIVAIVDESLSRKFMPTKEPVHPKVFSNLNNANKSGFEISAKLDFFNDFYLKSEMAYVHTKNKDLNESLPLTAPLITRFSFGFDSEKFWLNTQYNIVGKATQIAKTFGESETDNYQTLDLRFGINPTKNLTLGLAALNIFDKLYNSHLNFSFTNQSNFGRTPITEPGRNFSAFIQYKF